MKHDIFSALVSLRPGKGFSYNPDIGGYDGITYDTEDNGDTCPTESELNAEITRLTNAEAMKLLREQRNAKLVDCDWRAVSDLTMSDDWKTYRQALRDLPASTKRIVAFHNLDISGQPSGTSICYKITTHNQSASKDTQIHAVSYGWK